MVRHRDFMEFAHAIVEPEKSKVCRVGRQTRVPMERWHCELSLKAEIHPFLLRRQVSVISMRPSTNRARPTHTIQGNQSALLKIY